MAVVQSQEQYSGFGFSQFSSRNVPPALVASNVAGDYWVVKGYDRMSKSGGKLNELHGGLTYEEAIVPIVVFEKGAVFVPMPAVSTPKEQFVENDDFDL